MNDIRDDILDRSPLDLWDGEPSALATRARNTLYREDIWTVRELTERTSQDLLRIRQFGPVLLAEVQRVLAKHGLALAGDPS